MTPFTLVMAYYDNPGMLGVHVKAWLKLPEWIRENLHVRIVDDCSPRWSAEGVCYKQPAGWADALASFQLYRMAVDVPWNQDACRNLGVSHAVQGWVLLTDMDHVVPATTWARLMGKPHLDKRMVYRFTRVNAPNLDGYKQHPNSWAMTTDTFWKVGGYDEALAGNYGTDGDFLNRVRRVCTIEDLRFPIIRYPREVIADASTTTLTRKSEEQKRRVTALVKARGPKWRPLNLSFPFERVL